VNELFFAAIGAFWLGVLTSISPCLLATNVTAISFLARRVDSVRFVLISCACYIAGQSLAFVLLAMMLVMSLLSVQFVAHFLQAYMFRLLGPILIVCALFLFEMFSFQLGSGRMKAWVQARANTGGFWVAALLGIIFAMSFCPTTAALFFGSLLPFAIARESSVFLPLMYALGVAMPVMAFSLIIAISANRLTASFTRVAHAERYARQITGAVFLMVGIYFTIAYTLGLF
jgi:cytochrome c biogenesis protein CcdA